MAGETIGGMLFQPHSYLSGTNGFVSDPTKPGMVRRIAMSLRIAWDTYTYVCIYVYIFCICVCVCEKQAKV